MLSPSELKHLRENERNLALIQLEPLQLDDKTGRNGEEIATDEAAAWKRVISYRVAKHLNPETVFETHPGLGVGTQIYKKAGSCKSNSKSKSSLLIDIDPFGSPWNDIEQNIALIKRANCLMVTSGEVQGVVRNLQKTLKWPTKNIGRKAPQWVVSEYIPRLEYLTGLSAQFFYAYPTSVRVVLSPEVMPISLWDGCPTWMWWFKNYAP